MRRISLAKLFIMLLGIVTIGCHNNVATLNPNLPAAITALSCNQNVDSCFFNIEVKGDKYLIKRDKFYLLSQDTEKMQSFIKEEVKKNHIDQIHRFNVALSIDLETPFRKIDKLIEEFQLMGVYRLIFKCKNNQIALNFLPENNEIQQIVVQMYGSRFNFKVDLWEQSAKVISENPPPPPPPSLPIPLYYASKSKKDSEQAELAVVERIGKGYKVNGEPCNQENVYKAIYYKRNVLIKLSPDNTYSEMMDIVNSVNSVQRQKFNDQSQLRFKKNYCDLDQETMYELRRECGIAYSILTLAEQKFIAALSIHEE